MESKSHCKKLAPNEVLPPVVPLESETKARRKNPKQASGRWGESNKFDDAGARLVSTTEQACWRILFRHATNGEARISQQRIAESIGKGLRTVNRSLKKLEEVGLIKVLWRGGLNGGISTYRVYAYPPDSEGTS